MESWLADFCSSVCSTFSLVKLISQLSASHNLQDETVLFSKHLVEHSRSRRESRSWSQPKSSDDISESGLRVATTSAVPCRVFFLRKPGLKFIDIRVYSTCLQEHPSRKRNYIQVLAAHTRPPSLLVAGAAAQRRTPARGC